MQRSSIIRASSLVFACAAVLAAACSGDSGSTNPVTPLVAKSGSPGTPGGSDSAGGSPAQPAPTSSGPVASVRITPAQATLPVGNYLTLGVAGLDASGAVVGGARATLTSSDPSVVAVVSDTGSIVAKAVGTATIRATVDGHTASASIAVVAGPPTQPPPTPQPAVSQFDLVVTISGAIAGQDTSAATPLAGAIVKLTRTGGVTGDTLSTSIDAGSAATDASGNVSFKGLAGGAYMVDVTPPPGTSYQPIKTGFAPPREHQIHLGYRLWPRS